MAKKLVLASGEMVEIKAKNKSFSGVLVKTDEAEGLVIKLSSGYNVFLQKKEILSIKKLGKVQELSKPKAKDFSFNPVLPLISILQLGGTIASRVDYKTGAVTVSFEPNDLITMFPELEDLANFKSRLVGKMFSEDIRFAHYKKLVLEIKKEIEAGGIKGIIVAHGTDTMHYSSAALSFALENLPVPVILVGAQRSTDRGSSDASLNLVSAVQFITKTDFKGVAICMHEFSDDKTCVILPATKTRKLHTSRRDAFKAINALPVARVNPLENKIEFLEKPVDTQKGKGFVARQNFEEKVGFLKVHPNMFSFEIDFFRKNKYKGLVIEGTGLGHAPVGTPDELSKPNKKNMDAIKKLVKSGCVVAMASQCIYGSVQMHVYEAGVYLSRAGVISCQDMTAETAFVKLSWLLGNFPKKDVAQLMQENLRGEINERLQMNHFSPDFP